jgi:hypothetical protein
MAFEAFDGSRFTTERECLEHERSSADLLLVGLTHQDVVKAISREKSHLSIADAIENAGTTIRLARLKARDLRRASNKPKNGEDRDDKSVEAADSRRGI